MHLTRGVDGAGDQHVAAGVGDAPDADAVGVDLGQRRGEGDGVAVVLDLLPGVDVLARLAVAGAEAAVVEHQHRAAGRDQPLA